MTTDWGLIIAGIVDVLLIVGLIVIVLITPDDDEAM